MITLSLRARLTLWYTIALVLVLGLFGGDVLIEQKRLGIRRADQELESVQATLATILREELRELDAPELAAREAKDAMQSLGDGIVILDGSGRPLAAQLDRLTLTDVIENGIQIKGADTLAPIGIVTFTNVNVSGTFAKTGVAIRDFTNVTGDPDVAWLGAGIAETVTSDLAALDHFRVVDRWRVVQAGRRTDGGLHEIASAVGAGLT